MDQNLLKIRKLAVYIAERDYDGKVAGVVDYAVKQSRGRIKFQTAKSYIYDKEDARANPELIESILGYLTKKVSNPNWSKVNAAYDKHLRVKKFFGDSVPIGEVMPLQEIALTLAGTSRRQYAMAATADLNKQGYEVTFGAVVQWMQGDPKAASAVPRAWQQKLLYDVLRGVAKQSPSGQSPSSDIQKRLAALEASYSQAPNQDASKRSKKGRTIEHLDARIDKLLEDMPKPVDEEQITARVMMSVRKQLDAEANKIRKDLDSLAKQLYKTEGPKPTYLTEADIKKILKPYEESIASLQVSLKSLQGSFNSVSIKADPNSVKFPEGLTVLLETGKGKILCQVKKGKWLYLEGRNQFEYVAEMHHSKLALLAQEKMSRQTRRSTKENKEDQ